MRLSGAPLRSGDVVMHACDNPPCCNPAHLKVGTIADNNADMTSKGRAINPRGAAHGNAKLSVLQVRAIKAATSSGLRPTQIARRLGVSVCSVKDVVRGRNWKHVEPEPGDESLLPVLINEAKDASSTIAALRAEVERVTAERNAWRTALRNLTFTEGPDDPKAAVDHVAAYIADQIYDGVNLRGLALDVVDQLTSEYDDGEPTLCRGCECSGCSNGCAVNALRAALADTEAQR